MKFTKGLPFIFYIKFQFIDELIIGQCLSFIVCVINLMHKIYDAPFYYLFPLFFLNQKLIFWFFKIDLYTNISNLIFFIGKNFHFFFYIQNFVFWYKIKNRIYGIRNILFIFQSEGIKILISPLLKHA
jgi:hypothetical protein